MKRYCSDKENITLTGSIERGFRIKLIKVINEKGLFRSNYLREVDTILAPKSTFKYKFIVESEDEKYMINEFKKFNRKVNEIYGDFINNKRESLRKKKKLSDDIKKPKTKQKTTEEKKVENKK